MIIARGACLAAAILCTTAMNALRWQPPDPIRGWKPAGPPQHITAETIFDYMNGAGELYLAYAFASLDVWTLKRPGEGGILLEVYNISRPEEAFGVLSQDLEGAEVHVGDRSVYGAGLLRFCAGRYFVRILAELETDESKHAVLALGRSFAGAVDEGPSLPPIVAHLPKHNLKPQTVHYFHTKVCLDYLYYLADENILGLDRQTDAVLADYAAAGGKVRLLVVEYASEALARSAWERFHRVYLEQAPPPAGAINSRQIEGGRWISARLASNRLYLTFEAAQRQASESMLELALESLDRTR